MTSLPYKLPHYMMRFEYIVNYGIQQIKSIRE